MAKRIKPAFAVLLLAASEASAQFCPGQSPWVFDDVPSTHPFCTNITWIAQRGVTLGCAQINAGHRLYCPNANVTRGEMAAFLHRLGFNNSLLQGGNAFGATATLGTTDNQPLVLIAGGARVMRYEPNPASPNLIGGSAANLVTGGARGATIAGGGAPPGGDPTYGAEAPNQVTDHYGTVSGGFDNRAGDDAGSATDAAFATVGGGLGNRSVASYTTIAGGFGNLASQTGSAIGGGYGNIASGVFSAIGGGDSNEASGNGSAIGGGGFNDASGLNSTVGGGFRNIAIGQYSTVPGGLSNAALGDYSFAVGHRAKSFAKGSFTLADSNAFDFNSFTPNAFRVRATGGVRFVTDIDETSGGMVWSCVTVAGQGWTCTSDRNQKQNLRLLDGTVVLERLAAMPVYAWNPKGRNSHVDHYGPMAQDFHAAFGLGDDDTMIGSQDADGVALAAIQGLNAKLEAQAREIAGLRRLVDLLVVRTESNGLADLR